MTKQPIKPFYFDITEDEIEFFAEQSKTILKSGKLVLGENTLEFEKPLLDMWEQNTRLPLIVVLQD